jgi:hypothetical protein
VAERPARATSLCANPAPIGLSQLRDRMLRLEGRGLAGIEIALLSMGVTEGKRPVHVQPDQLLSRQARRSSRAREEAPASVRRYLRPGVQSRMGHAWRSGGRTGRSASSPRVPNRRSPCRVTETACRTSRSAATVRCALPRHPTVRHGSGHLTSTISFRLGGESSRGLGVKMSAGPTFIAGRVPGKG